MPDYQEEPKRRATLRQYFREGQMPTEESFFHLIDSAVNRVDDGYHQHPRYGLQLRAGEVRPTPGVGQRVLSFYRSLQQLQGQCTSWFMSLLPANGQADGPLGLGFSEAQDRRDTGLPADDDNPPPVRVYLAPGGHVGIGTTHPDELLSVRGFVGSAGRIGTFQQQPPQPAGHAAPPGRHEAVLEVPADGNWYAIVSNLRGLWAFEVMAAAYGPPDSGTYAMAHAVALGVHGQPQRIRPHRAGYRGWRQQIQFCWQVQERGTQEQRAPLYELLMRTRKPFGPGAVIVYHITCLFDNCQPRAWHPASGR